MELEELVQQFAGSRFHRLEVAIGDQEVTLRRSASSTKAKNAAAPPSIPVREAEEHRVLSAPRVGVFTSRVQVGDKLEIGMNIGSIKAMNIQHEISAQEAGEVKAVLVESGDGVQFGDPLIELLGVEV